jgi:hypothetical protein
MYKFSNGVVVFTEEDKEAFIKAGYVLVKEENENKDNSGTIKEQSKASNKITSRVRK